ncbi:MAG: hypothetical protein KBA86_04225 [Bacteroidales bacterium]|nr:hypothetical protein [Bacteroidales bacterium]
MQETIQFINAMLTPLIAIITVYIACQQFLTNKKNSKFQNEINKDKLKLDLFEKRYKIFEETHKILIEIIEKGGIEINNIQTFSDKTKSASFLFNNDIIDLLKNIRNFDIELLEYTKTLNRSSFQNDNCEDTSEIYRKKWEIMRWFQDQQQNILDLFGTYLDFKKLY